MNYYLWKNSFPGIKLIYLPADKGFDLVYSIKKTDDPIVSILNKGIKAISPARKSELINNWLRIDQVYKPILNDAESRFISRFSSINLVTIEQWMPIVSVSKGRMEGFVADYLEFPRISYIISASGTF